MSSLLKLDISHTCTLSTMCILPTHTLTYKSQKQERNSDSKHSRFPNPNRSTIQVESIEGNSRAICVLHPPCPHLKGGECLRGVGGVSREGGLGKPVNDHQWRRLVDITRLVGRRRRFWCGSIWGRLRQVRGGDEEKDMRARVAMHEAADIGALWKGRRGRGGTCMHFCTHAHYA